VRFIDKFLEGILQELHNRFDGLPINRVKREALDLLEENLLDPDETLEVFLDDLCVCRQCGAAWPEYDMWDAQDETGAYHLCRECYGFWHRYR